MKRYINSLARVSLIIAGCVGVPALVISFFGLHLENGWMLPVTCLAFTAVVFAVCMLPALRFW